MLWYLFRGEAEQDVIKNYVHIFPFVDLVWFYQYLCNRSTFCYMVSGCLAAHSNNYEICIFQHRHTHTHTIIFICSLDSHACMHMHAGTHTHTHLHAKYHTIMELFGKNSFMCATALHSRYVNCFVCESNDHGFPFCFFLGGGHLYHLLMFAHSSLVLM